MKRPAVIDTNVLVAGLLTAVSSNGGNGGQAGDSATVRILDGMVSAAFPFVLSVELLSEYRQVLLGKRPRALHDLKPAEIDKILTEIALNGVIIDVLTGGAEAPDSGDQHLWDLLSHQPHAVLVSGDQRLLEHPPENASILSPRAFLVLAP